MVAHLLGFVEDAGRSHAPPLPAVSNIFQHFGGNTLQPESDISAGDRVDSLVVSVSGSDSSVSGATAGAIFIVYLSLLRGLFGVGAGLLYLPAVFGLWSVGTGVMAAVALMTTFGLMRLADCGKQAGGLSYAEVMYAVSGKKLSLAVNFMMWVKQVTNVVRGG